MINFNLGLNFQFCGNNPDVLVKAAALAKPYCDGIDINLGMLTYLDLIPVGVVKSLDGFLY